MTVCSSLLFSCVFHYLFSSHSRNGCKVFNFPLFWLHSMDSYHQQDVPCIGADLMYGISFSCHFFQILGCLLQLNINMLSMFDLYLWIIYVMPLVVKQRILLYLFPQDSRGAGRKTQTEKHLSTGLGQVLAVWGAWSEDSWFHGYE